MKSEGMEDKYYTPDLESFYIGFEFEVEDFNCADNNQNDEHGKYWIKRTIKGIDDGTTLHSGSYNTLKTIDLLNAVYVRNTYRVKFLDASDIESEGWVIYGHSDFKSMGNFKNFDIIKLYAENEYAIRKITDQTKDAEILFRGTIKNINELRVIQKMIGIK